MISCIKTKIIQPIILMLFCILLLSPAYQLQASPSQELAKLNPTSIISLTNTARVQVGVFALTHNTQLQEVDQTKASLMVEEETFAYTLSNNVTV